MQAGQLDGSEGDLQSVLRHKHTPCWTQWEMWMVVNRSASKTNPTPIAFLRMEVVYTGVLNVFWGTKQKKELDSQGGTFKQWAVFKHKCPVVVWLLSGPFVWGDVPLWGWLWEWGAQQPGLLVCSSLGSLSPRPNLLPPSTYQTQSSLMPKRLLDFRTTHQVCCNQWLWCHHLVLVCQSRHPLCSSGSLLCTVWKDPEASRFPYMQLEPEQSNTTRVCEDLTAT